MLRVLFFIISLLLGAFLFLQIEQRSPKNELPVFLREDTIADNHNTNIEIQTRSREIPTPLQLENLTKDYSALWAHLNHLYATNDVEAGKEYYTEEWFRQLCLLYAGVKPVRLSRTDLKHQVKIINWEKDGLVCTVIDSSAVMKYHFPDRAPVHTAMTLAAVLLYQGDHWRLDALRILNEKEVKDYKTNQL